MNLVEQLENLFFPLPCYCPLCGRKQEKLQICQECHQRLIYRRSQYGQCQHCATFGYRAKACSNCRHWPQYFVANYSAWPYQEEYRAVIKAFKFGNQPWLAECLAREMLPFLPADYDVLVPIPLHWTRLRERGYNQSLLLAKALSKLSGLPCQEYLVRTRATKHQVELSRKERKSNLQQAFAVKNNENLKQQKIILVDDIFTTGATVLTCGQVLHQAGAKYISSVTLASGVD